MEGTTFDLNSLLQEAFKELQVTQEAYLRAQGKVQLLQDLGQKLQQPQSEPTPPELIN